MNQSENTSDHSTFKWIPLSEKKPEQGWLCWAFIPDGGYKNGLLLSFFFNGTFCDVLGYAYGATERVTHWIHIEQPDIPMMQELNKVIEEAQKLDAMKEEKRKKTKEKKKEREKRVKLALAEGTKTATE